MGRRRVFVAGLVSFAVASALCGLAPGARTLVLARAVQGLAAALLVPGSLAILRASFRPEDAGRAVGTWAALSGVTTAIGPLAGGWLADAVSWRAIFFVNAPLAAIALRAALRSVPESRDPARGGVDVAGAALAAAGLGGIVLALIEGGAGRAGGGAWVAGGAGVAALAAFFVVEARRRDPMLPLSLFASRTFSAVNGVTLAVYFALGGAFFLVVLQLQVGLGWSPLAAGAALTPVTLLILVLSPAGGTALRARRAAPAPRGGPARLRGGARAARAGRTPAAATCATCSPGSRRSGWGSGSRWRRSRRRCSGRRRRSGPGSPPP